MRIASIPEAKAQSPALIERALAGRDAVIGKDPDRGRLRRMPADKGLETTPPCLLARKKPSPAGGIPSEHAHALAELPMHHRDLSDRMLIARAMAGKLALLTADNRFNAYDIPPIRA